MRHAAALLPVWPIALLYLSTSTPPSRFLPPPPPEELGLHASSCPHVCCRGVGATLGSLELTLASTEGEGRASLSSAVCVCVGGGAVVVGGVSSSVGQCSAKVHLLFICASYRNAECVSMCFVRAGRGYGLLERSGVDGSRWADRWSRVV